MHSFTLKGIFRASQKRLDKARRADNGRVPWQAAQRRHGVFGELPSGAPQRSHLRCYTPLKGGWPFRRECALHLAALRLAENAFKSEGVH